MNQKFSGLLTTDLPSSHQQAQREEAQGRSQERRHAFKMGTKQTKNRKRAGERMREKRDRDREGRRVR